MILFTSALTFFFVNLAPGGPSSIMNMSATPEQREVLIKNMGLEPGFGTAILAKEFSFTPPLTYFLQVRIEYKDGLRMAWPDAGGGSGDFANLKNVDGFLELPPSKNEFSAGEAFSFIPFRSV